MARPLRIQYPGAFYHVTCRGNERKRIFLDDEDRHRFLQFLAESLEAYDVVLHAFVMMSNHFHLVVQTMRANLSEFMRRFNICYTGWFNYHHGACGHLYQGRYKSFLVDADDYLLELSRYVHLNPVRIDKTRQNGYQERFAELTKYRWSSLPGYLSQKHAIKSVNYELVLELAHGYRRYREFILDGLRKETGDLFKDVRHQTILGDDDFVASVKNKYLAVGSLREQPAYRAIKHEIIEPATVTDCVARSLGIDIKELSARSDNCVERGIAAELLYRYSNISQKQIGRILGGIDYTGVSMLRSRLKTKMASDHSIQRRYLDAEKCLCSFVKSEDLTP